jgi:L-alanine-DL-glutamate epimerase-like enolase superfamily enzyme
VDLTGKLLGMPVRKILSGGAFTDKVRAYWTMQPAEYARSGVLPGVGGIHQRLRAEVDSG